MTEWKRRENLQLVSETHINASLILVASIEEVVYVGLLVGLSFLIFSLNSQGTKYVS